MRGKVSKRSDLQKDSLTSFKYRRRTDSGFPNPAYLYTLIEPPTHCHKAFSATKFTELVFF